MENAEIDPWRKVFSEEEADEWWAAFAALPEQMRKAVEGHMKFHKSLPSEFSEAYMLTARNLVLAFGNEENEVSQ